MKETLIDVHPRLSKEDKEIILLVMKDHVGKEFNIGMIPFMDTLTVLDAMIRNRDGKGNFKLFNLLFRYYVDFELKVKRIDFYGGGWGCEVVVAMEIVGENHLQKKYKDLLRKSWVEFQYLPMKGNIQ